MTYARARLWLGISGVGSLVTFSTIALLLGWPSQFFNHASAFGMAEFTQLLALVGGFLLWIAPFDFLGGYWLPRQFNKSSQSLIEWARDYLPAVIIQAFLFVSFGALILIAGRTGGMPLGVVAIVAIMLGCYAVRTVRLRQRKSEQLSLSRSLIDAIDLAKSWGVEIPETFVVDHRDMGFTGGIIGLGRQVAIVIPRRWLDFSKEHLATAIARRAVAISSGSYRRGLWLAALWNVVGFVVSGFLLGASAASVAGLVTTLCGFTLWSFLGLLLLPTISRNASLGIDQVLLGKGTPNDLIATTAFAVDQLQDGEPHRNRWVEVIFHPVPNVTSRQSPPRGLAAWNVARTTLFLSWACLGVLSRSVHCNVGRPELWTTLPTD